MWFAFNPFYFYSFIVILKTFYHCFLSFCEYVSIFCECFACCASKIQNEYRNERSVIRNFRFFSALIFSFLRFSAITMSHYSPTIPQVSIFLVLHLPRWGRRVKRQKKIIHRGAFRKGAKRKQCFHQGSVSMNQSAGVRNLKENIYWFCCHI